MGNDAIKGFREAVQFQVKNDTEAGEVKFDNLKGATSFSGVEGGKGITPAEAKQDVKAFHAFMSKSEAKNTIQDMLDKKQLSPKDHDTLLKEINSGGTLWKSEKA